MKEPSGRMITKINDDSVPPDGSVIIISAEGNPALRASGTVNIADNTVTCTLTRRSLTPPPPVPAQVIPVTAVGNSWDVNFGAKNAGTYFLACTAPDEPGDSIT